jgi:universal stress protein E
MDRLTNVLVGVDFSPCSGNALAQAVRLARWNRAEVGALHVVQIPVYALSPDPFLPSIIPPIGLLLDEARARWSTWPPARQSGDGVRFDAVFGAPRAELLDRAQRSGCDLLVLGAHGEFDAGRGIGSTAAACVQKAPTKVLLVREGQSGPYRSVVACIDFSDTSRLALEQAVRIAAQDGAALHVLHIYDDPWRRLPASSEFKANMPDAPEQYRRAVEGRLRSFCEPLSHEVAALRAVFHARPFEGHGRGIIDFVERERADLVILGARGSWNLRDAMLGSTAERVVRHAPCSVLTIKPAQAVKD